MENVYFGHVAETRGCSRPLRHRSALAGPKRLRRLIRRRDRRLEGLVKLLSDDDIDLKDLTDEELARAWDLWFDLAQATNDDDPPWTHGVFVLADLHTSNSPSAD